ncbi:MAG TPA: LacI family DNA-binding transcriptional regulator [Acidimicrobiales bacterium]|nr:LacI family DNA-binding transcriptional regulator [Acidimicrobiales bacterium]
MTTPTLADVAEAVGVSRTTVSNAYNRPDQLSAELRERILAAAAGLGYPGPDPVARGLRRGRTGMFGLVYDQPLSYLFTDPAILAFMAGMSGVWDDAGVSLAVLPSLHPDDAGTSVLAAAGVDGFVSICDVADDSRVAALVTRRLPFVTVDAGESSGRCRVGIDDRRASADATRHLLDLGHRRLAVVALPRGRRALTGSAGTARPGPERFTVSGARLAGIRDAVEAAGLPWASVPVQSVADLEPPRPLGRRLGGLLLDRAERPTGVVAMSDELAAGVLDAAAERGVEVPGQLSVVGFDDTPTATSVSPALTTVHQPLAAKGQTAARLLLEGAPATVIRLPTELRVRASTGPAPGP